MQPDTLCLTDIDSPCSKCGDSEFICFGEGVSVHDACSACVWGESISVTEAISGSIIRRHSTCPVGEYISLRQWVSDALSLTLRVLSTWCQQV